MIEWLDQQIKLQSPQPRSAIEPRRLTWAEDGGLQPAPWPRPVDGFHAAMLDDIRALAADDPKHAALNLLADLYATDSEAERALTRQRMLAWQAELERARARGELPSYRRAFLTPASPAAASAFKKRRRR